MTTTIVGSLASEVELRFTHSGKPVCNFRVGVKGRGQDAKWTHFQCQAWDKLAENMAASLSKGDRVIVTGDFEEQEWESQDGSKKGSKMVLNAWDVGAALRFNSMEIERNPRDG